MLNSIKESSSINYQELVEKYGTPIYVLNQIELDRSIKEVEDAFLNFPVNIKVAYPYKTNSIKRICEYIYSKGKWAEVSSGLEMRMALQIGVKPEQIVFNSAYKSDDDLQIALHLGCKFNIDNMEELGRISQLINIFGLPKAKVGIRVNPMNGTKWDKFGFALDKEAYETVKHIHTIPNIELSGVHVHRSSIEKLEEYREHITPVLRFASTITSEGLARLEYIDLGSGFAVEFPAPISKENWTVPTMNQYAEIILSTWKEFSLPEEIYLIIEPGKRLVASAISLLTKVVSIKERAERNVVIVDAGHCLMAGVDFNRHPVWQIKNCEAVIHKELYDIHGCLCDSLDVLRENVLLFPLETGEVLRFGNVGGYDMSRSFMWQIPRAAVLWIDENSNCEVIRAKEGIEDIWKLCL